MPSGKVLLCLILVAVWHNAESASLPMLLSHVNNVEDIADVGEMMVPAVQMRAVREGVPPPLCAGVCASPPTGPVCAFDATGTARTFATSCELEAASCRESTYYAITSMGEC